MVLGSVCRALLLGELPVDGGRTSVHSRRPGHVCVDRPRQRNGDRDDGVVRGAGDMTWRHVAACTALMWVLPGRAAAEFPSAGSEPLGPSVFQREQYLAKVPKTIVELQQFRDTVVVP